MKRKEMRILMHDEYKQHQKDECANCGIKNGYYAGDYYVKRKVLTIHHIDHNILNNDPENLMTLCRKCHDIEHDMIANPTRNKMQPLTVWREGKRYPLA